MKFKIKNEKLNVMHYHTLTASQPPKTAFTLAEVLITLGVIGVVAAMTLPTLIQNYNKKAWTTQLQKSYSMWEQAFQKIMADDGVQKLSDTSVWASKGSTSCSASNIVSEENCAEFFNNLKNYIKIIGVENYGNKINYITGDNSRDDSNTKYLVLSDGTMINFQTGENTKSKEVCDTIKSLGGSMCSVVATFEIDVNGQRGPNTFGRDVFEFRLSDNGKLYPMGGKDFAVFNNRKALNENNEHWQKRSTKRGASCGTPGGGITGSNIEGTGCAARIMENGWKMDY